MADSKQTSQGKWSYRQRRNQFGHVNGGPVRRLTREEIDRLYPVQDKSKNRN